MRKNLLILILLIFIFGCTPLAPSKEEKSRIYDSQRSSDVATIKIAMEQYYFDNKNWPNEIPLTETEICKNENCEGLVDLSFLTKNEDYLVAVPWDPEGTFDENENGSGYTLLKRDGQIIIKAPQALGDKKIEAVVEVKETQDKDEVCSVENEEACDLSCDSDSDCIAPCPLSCINKD